MEKGIKPGRGIDKRENRHELTPPHVIITLEGPPIQKGRPRVTRFGTFTPKKTKAYQHALGLAAMRAMAGREIITCPVEVMILLTFEPPASWSQRKRAAACALDFAPAVKPDIDNLAKSVLDGLNGVVFQDDAQCYHLVASKEYGRIGQTGVRVIPRPDLVYMPNGSQPEKNETGEYRHGV